MSTNTLLEYIKWRGELTFKDVPFNDVDAMVLSQLSSIDYRHIVPGADHVEELRKNRFENMPTISEVSERANGTLLVAKETSPTSEIFEAAAQSVRYRNIRMDGAVCDIDSENIKQFSAITFFITRRLSYIVFRGTDDTFVSWRENFHMSFMFPILSQVDAVKYLDTMSRGLLSRCMVGGHSKGGNLAIYASTFCQAKTQKRIKRIFAFDSPGFVRDLREIPAFGGIQKKIAGYMPKGSAIGTIMTVPYDSMIVESDVPSFSQHHMYTWEIMGSKVMEAEGREEFSYKFEHLLEEKLEGVPIEDRPQYIEEFFKVFSDNNINRISDFSNMDFKQMWGIVRKGTAISPINRDLLLSILKLLWEEQRKK